MTFKAMEYHFHPSRKARDLYKIDDTLFTLRGSVFFGSMRDAQLLAAKMNERRKGNRLLKPVGPAELYAAGILHEVFHVMIDLYRRSVNPDVFRSCDSDLHVVLTPEVVEKFLRQFVDLFPPQQVYRGETTPEQYLADHTELLPHRHISLEELILVWLENRNTALKPLAEIIDDKELKNTGVYAPAMNRVDQFFDAQPPFGAEKVSLIKMLLQPVLKSPESLMGQLDFIRVNWEKYIGHLPIFRQLLTAQDFIREEGKYFAMMAAAEADRLKMLRVKNPDFWGWGEKPSQAVTTFHGAEFEPERFSTDVNWMPRLVLMAKTTFVWLDQLSKKYNRAIRRLDEIPDEELDILAQRGFTGLWLIGIWQRSPASQRIKHLHGNIDAVASAYSLNDYNIAPELGGEDGYRNLRDRAAARGLRLASDMVPNHMGMDSLWVIHHPEWFLQADYPPFPNYSFNGPDLSSDARVGVFIEDGYWRKTDAAVVFKRLDRWTGDVRYLYHGNDGTSMPWNDTAQLNFMKPEVREAVIQTIVHVARMFPIIRFDAAMILAKRHFQRLWFPLPGTGGAIPSRANYSMTKDQFDAQIPVEFWREVVDRVQREAPDTLLLAEAFWMMEGYFVRSLGMHRVYNSAFMNMLKKEENANYRTTIKNVLEFNPGILKRFVNFMNNPDEETAVAQFGKDDKYFGVCILMCTMPGLPMFGHGQIEGFTEKYGMEYRRAYYNELPDEYLVHRHNREIFPLLQKRYLFSDVENFFLYDVVRGDGYVNEDVFAYSNRHGGERGLVVYNNRFAHAQGRVKHSVGFLQGGRIIRKSLAEGLGLSHDDNTFCIFRDVVSGLEHIHRNRALIDDGLWTDLQAFKYHVFLDFREVQPSHTRPYDRLERVLQGRGVLSIEEELADLRLQPIHDAFREAIGPDHLHALMQATGPAGPPQHETHALRQKLNHIVGAIGEIEGYVINPDHLVHNVLEEFTAVRGLASAAIEGQVPLEDWQIMLREMISLPVEDRELPGWRILLVWLVGHRLHGLLPGHIQNKRNIVDDWRLEKITAHALQRFGVEQSEAWREASLLHILMDPGVDDRMTEGRPLDEDIAYWMRYEPVRSFLGVNRYDGIEYFNKEKFELFIRWGFVLRTLRAMVNGSKAVLPAAAEELDQSIINTWAEAISIIDRANTAGYMVENLLAAVMGGG